MADRNNADFRHHLTVDAPPHPIPKDMQGSDHPIPLSPQWLLPKPGDSKLGVLSGEPHSGHHHGNQLDAEKAPGNGEDSHDAGKRKDAFRPSLYDSETGRRDRWRDEERETGSAIRRDRWRESEKELGDTRRIERWSDNSSRHSGEARRAPSERWSDSGNRENSYDQRRESKWNTRWGPDDKEPEIWREKWSDTNRDADGSRDKGSPHLTIHGKDIISQGKETEKDAEHFSRSWRSNSALARGRGEPSHHQMSTPNKQGPVFGYGRGKGENGSSIYSAGRGRVSTNINSGNNGSSRPYPVGFITDRSDGGHGDPFALRYSRMKLLDIYRSTDLKSLRVSLEGFIEVPSLTIAEPVEPLALSVPTSEESVTLKGIDKGDIVSSGLPQVNKDGSTAKNFTDSVTPKQLRSGIREDSASTRGDYKDESTDNVKGDHFSYLESPSYEKYSHQDKYTVEASRLDGTLKNADEMRTKETSMLERSSSHYTTPWRSNSAGEHSHGLSQNWQDLSSEARTRTSDMGWSHLQKNMENELKNSTAVSSSYFRDESQWQSSNLHSELKKDSKIKRQSSEVLDLEREGAVMHGQETSFISRDKPSASKIPPHLSPEDLSLYYRDPQGRIQGPFSGSDLIGWFEAGYFGIDLHVRLASAPADAPFSVLGDVMPHLRAKARPPPGFGAAKQNDAVEVSSWGRFGTMGNSPSAIGEFEALKSVQRGRHEAGTEAENRFIESLMSGMQGYGGPSGGENMNDMNYLLAQRMSLERQRSLPTSVPYWPGRDSSSIVSKSDVIPESPTPHTKFLSPMGDSSHQIPQSPQQVDFLSLLQAAADKSPSPAVNSAVPVWQNFSDVRSLNSLVHGMDIMKDKIDMHHNQHISSQPGFGANGQRLHAQGQPSLSHLLSKPVDLSSGVMPPEKLLAPEISQDPQIVNLLQQQYLMSQIQLHSQTPLPAHLSLLDKYLLLKQQQQKQEQQQQQQLLLQQQQHLLSQVLSGHQSNQHLGEQSFGHLKASAPAGNASVDHIGLHQIHETLHNNQQLPIHNSLDGISTNHSKLKAQSLEDVNYTVSMDPGALHLPHQMFDHATQSKERSSNLSQEVERIAKSDSQTTFAMADGLVLSDAIEKMAQEVAVEQINMLKLDNNVMQNEAPVVGDAGDNSILMATGAINGPDVSEASAGTSNIKCSVSEPINVKISPESIPEQCNAGVSAGKATKDVEVREVKKASEKKSRKQKNAKVQSVSELGKGSSKAVNSQQLKPDFEIEDANTGGKRLALKMETAESLHATVPLQTGVGDSVASAADISDSQHDQLATSTNIPAELGNTEWEAGQGEVGKSSVNSHATLSHRAWKPAPGLKPKSLLEIQQEEQRRVQTETVSSEIYAMMAPTNSSPTPWAGVIASLDHQSHKGIVQNPSSVSVTSENPWPTSKSRKSQLHDLLAEEVLAKSNEGDMDISDENGSSLLPLSQVSAQVDIQSVEDDFVEAKDTKKSRKKAAKAKGAGLKASPPVVSTYLSASPIPTDKGKITRQAQQEKEVLPVPPAGPSLGDFVLWKGDQANSSPAPAWSTDSTKLQKPTPLREILREQEKRSPSVQQQIPIPTPPKVQSNRGNRGSGSSWPVPGSSPSKSSSPSQTKAASPMRTSSLIPIQSKAKTEDDLFWGPLDQAKQETKQSDFPSLANSSGRAGKGSAVKGASGASANRQKPPSANLSSPAPAQSLSKGKRDVSSKNTEATDFRDWCESELVKLTGTNDTSFLEFCLKQSTTEAEMLLRENLGSLDRNHEFIDKFLNYKDFLLPDVIEMAFRLPSNRKASGDNHAGKDTGTINTADADGGGRKKGKKGKKVNPAVLGFNVVSNRIMKGEIQTIED